MMEKVKGFDRLALINELVQGMEYAKELRNQFSNPKTNNNNSCSSSSISNDDANNQALNYSLLEKMLASFDKTINIANSIAHNSSQINMPNSCSPKSKGNSHLVDAAPPSKRRKSMLPKWTKSVQVSNGGVISGLEGALDDGFSWRKYGQKDILGAKFPRGYYRCTHRPTRGCAATKQVQQSNEDPTIYQIMYKGEHTCTQVAHFTQPNLKPIFPAQMKSEPQPPPSPQQQQEIYLGLGPEGELKMEPEQYADCWAQCFDPISFTSAYTEPEPLDNMLSFSPSFGSPATSGSNCPPVSPHRATGAHVGLTVQTSETDNNEVVSGPNSVTNSPAMGDFEFPIDDLLFDIGSYFSHNFDF